MKSSFTVKIIQFHKPRLFGDDKYLEYCRGLQRGLRLCNQIDILQPMHVSCSIVSQFSIQFIKMAYLLFKRFPLFFFCLSDADYIGKINQLLTEIISQYVCVRKIRLCISFLLHAGSAISEYLVKFWLCVLTALENVFSVE